MYFYSKSLLLDVGGFVKGIKKYSPSPWEVKGQGQPWWQKHYCLCFMHLKDNLGAFIKRVRESPQSQASNSGQSCNHWVSMVLNRIDTQVWVSGAETKDDNSFMLNIQCPNQTPHLCFSMNNAVSSRCKRNPEKIK
jgi:hypothetical protein